MKELRRWDIDPQQPISLVLAADVRLGRTNYLDDQVWELSIGALESPALSLQTKYGGRAGLVSLVPMWQIDNQIIYQSQAYSTPPTITHFAPNYIQANGKILPEIALQAHYWAMESQAVGGIFVLTNTSQQKQQLRLDLFGHVIINAEEQTLGIVNLSKGGNALHLGQIGNINPVLLVEGGDAGSADSPKVGVDVILEPGKTQRIRWIHAGLTQITQSLTLAQNWLKTKWSDHIKQIDKAAQAIPIIQTGNDQWDMAIASAYNKVVQAFIKPHIGLPHPSFVATRTAMSGFSRKGDGTDYLRAWEGQDFTLAYMIAPLIASVDAKLAQTIVLNYLAVQQSDGWIDSKPGMAGQKQNQLLAPILARIAWEIYQQAEDDEFLKEIYPKLEIFVDRWFADDLDANKNGLPEWQTERQTGYVAFPTFGMARDWAQGADIRYVESPDLAAYLLSEIQSLQQIAEVIGKNASRFDSRKESLLGHLKTMWNGTYFTYRDRDTGESTKGVQILQNEPGDGEYFPALTLDPPNRLIVRVIGGVRHTPAMKFHIEGFDADGNKISTTTPTDDFLWQHRRGVYTTPDVFSQVDKIYCEGLSRVYTISVSTVDTTKLSVNNVLPLWSGTISDEQVESLIKLIHNKTHFRRPMGYTMVPASQPEFDPSNANGGGGIWLYWLTLLVQGFSKYGVSNKVDDVVKDVLAMQTEVLRETKAFWQFYHSDKAKGLGERHSLLGIPPLALIMELAGIRIISASKVWTGGEFGWGKSIVIRQHGVIVQRNRNRIRITFPSGHKVELDKDAEWQAVVDPKPKSDVAIEPLQSPDLPKSSPPKSSNRVMIEVEFDD